MRTIALPHRLCAKAICIALMLESATCFAPTGSEPLSKAGKVLALTSSQARQNLPVALHGVVTFSAPSFQLCFMQDETGGIYFYPPQPDALELRPGDKIELAGVTGHGRFAPFVYGAKPKKIGKGVLPQPSRWQPRICSPDSTIANTFRFRESCST